MPVCGGREGGQGQGQGVTSCHAAGKSASVSHICQGARGACLRAAGSKGNAPPAELSDQISSPVNKPAAVTVTHTDNAATSSVY